MERFFIWFLCFVLFFMLTISMLYLKKIVFFEDETEQTRKRMRKLIGGQILFSTALVLAFINREFSHSVTANILLGVLFVYIYAIIVYSSFKSRPSRKWVAFIMPCLLFVLVLSIYSITRVLYTIFGYYFPNDINSTYILTGLFAVILLVVHIARRREGSLVYKIEKYAEGRNLNAKEELLVCMATVALGVAEYLSVYVFTSTSAKLLTMLYGFILAIVIVFTVFCFNGRHYYENQSHRLQRILITTMADLVENRDENTGGHIKRTARYVEAIAKELLRENKFPEILCDSYINDMVIAAPLHDIGKIHIPDAILDKPGRLTEEEFEIMKTHTTAGYKIIRHVEKQSGEISYIGIAKQMAKSHHEWMNGRGYPEGLVGDRIPLCAKILAVADVFDALVSKRCYKEPMPLDKAYEIIRKESGDHFDPAVVDAFFAAQETIEQILREDTLERSEYAAVE